MKILLPLKTPRLKAYAFAIVATAIWGIAGPVIKYTLGGIDPLSFLVYRFGISTITSLILFMFIGIHFPKDPKTLFTLLLYCFLSSTVALGLLFFGMENTTVLETEIITLMVPILTSVAGGMFLKEHITSREKIGMVIALAGTLFTVFKPILEGGNMRFSGNLLIFLYLLVNIIPAIQGKRLLRKGVGPNTLASFSFIVGFATLLPFAIWKSGGAGLVGEILNLPFTYHLGVLFMALLSGNLAYYLFNKAQKTIEVGDASIFAYLYPVFATPLAVLWLGEKITPGFVIGGVIIIVGVIIAEYKGKKLTTPKLKVVGSG